MGQDPHRERESVSGGNCFLQSCWLPSEPEACTITKCVPSTVLTAHCFPHTCEPGISRGREGNGRTKSLINGLWVQQESWLSQTQNRYFVSVIFTAFYIFFVVFLFIRPLCFLWWCSFSWISFWKSLPVSVVLKGNKKKEFFSTGTWMLKEQEHGGSGGWEGTGDPWECRQQAWAAGPAGPESPSNPLLLVCLDFFFWLPKGPPPTSGYTTDFQWFIYRRTKIEVTLKSVNSGMTPVSPSPSSSSTKLPAWSIPKENIIHHPRIKSLHANQLDLILI